MIARETLLFESCVKRFPAETSARITSFDLLVFRYEDKSLDNSFANIYEPVPCEAVRITC